MKCTKKKRNGEVVFVCPYISSGEIFRFVYTKVCFGTMFLVLLGEYIFCAC